MTGGEIDIANYIMQGGFAGMCIILLLIGYKIFVEKQKTIDTFIEKTDTFIEITKKFIDHQKETTKLVSRNNEILDEVRTSLHEIRIYLNVKNNGFKHDTLSSKK